MAEERIPPAVGPERIDGRHDCAYTGRTDDGPVCGLPVTNHVLTASDEHGVVMLATCPAHERIAREAGRLLGVHPFTAGSCDADEIFEAHWCGEPDPTTPLDLEAIRSRLVQLAEAERSEESAWGGHPTVMMRRLRSEICADVPALLADLDAAREALRRVEQERDDANTALRGAAIVRLESGEWMKQTIAELERERDDARAERDRMRPVVEAALNWKHSDDEVSVSRLSRAVDTYETQEGTDGPR